MNGLQNSLQTKALTWITNGFRGHDLETGLAEERAKPRSGSPIISPQHCDEHRGDQQKGSLEEPA